jgi:hypothetical protein
MSLLVRVDWEAWAVSSSLDRRTCGPRSYRLPSSPIADAQYEYTSRSREPAPVSEQTLPGMSAWIAGRGRGAP